jgi:hypothetical protein
MFTVYAVAECWLFHNRRDVNIVATMRLYYDAHCGRMANAACCIRHRPLRERNMDTVSNFVKSIGAGVLTLAFLVGVGYFFYVALFNVTG